MTIRYDEDLYNEMKDFLSKSNDKYGTDIERAKLDLEFYSGDQWTNDIVNGLKRTRRYNTKLSELPKYMNSIKSAATKSPYHTEVIDAQDKDYGERIQWIINKVEAENQYKKSILDALESTIITGTGPLLLTTVDKYGIAFPIVESIRDISSVAFDADCLNDDMSDAEAGAIVQYMSKAKAARLYGEDIEEIDDRERTSFPVQWIAPKNNLPVISYYKLTNDGCKYYKFVGKSIVEEGQLSINMIPLFKMTGYIVYRDCKFISTGIVDRIKELQIGQNVAYSQLVERMNRSVKAGYICEAESIQGLENQIDKLSDGTVPLFVYKKGSEKPTPITEAFNTQDLMNVITTSKSIMSDIIGIPSAGINGIHNMNTTATEVLVQQQNSESNVSVFYESMNSVCMNIGRCVAQILTGNIELPFTVRVVNGPDVISRNAKRRLDIMQLSSMVPDNVKPILAKYYAESLDDGISESIAANITANLDENTKLVEEGQDPAAIHQLNQAKGVIEQQSTLIEELQKKVEDLQKQNEISSLEILNQRESRSLEWQKFVVEKEYQAKKDAAELALKNQELANDFQAEMEKLNQNATKMINDTIKDNDTIIEAALDNMTTEEAENLLAQKYVEENNG